MATRTIRRAVAGTVAAAFTIAAPGEAAVESLGGLHPDSAIEEPLWGVELRPAHPTLWQPLTITVDDTRQAMPALLVPGTQRVKIPAGPPLNVSEEVAFESTAHTQAASATAVFGIPAVTVATPVPTAVVPVPSWPSAERHPRLSTDRPYIFKVFPHAALARRGWRGQ